MNADVLVIGAGCAGIAAALGASACGASVLLLEKEPSIGGTVSSAFVHSTCGLYEIDSPAEAPPLSPGFATAFASALLASGKTQKMKMGRLSVLLHHPKTFLHICSSFLSQNPLLQTCTDTKIVSAKTENGEIRSVDFISPSGKQTVVPRTVVDASGDASFSLLAGAPCKIAPPEKLQRPAYIFEIPQNALRPQNLLLDDDSRLALAGKIAAAALSGSLPKETLGATFRQTGDRESVFVSLDVSPDSPYNPNNLSQLSEIQAKAHETAKCLFRFLKRETPFFAEAENPVWPHALGIRESWRITGKYELTDADLLSSATFPDSVASSAWPMELRETTRGPKLLFPKTNRPCGIPLRCLQSSRFENLFAAGKIISATHEAQASTRVIGTCLSTGEAAGIAAALLAQKRLSSAAINEQKLLQKYRFSC